MGAPPSMSSESLVFSVFFPVFFIVSSLFFQFPTRFLEEMPLRNHSAWLQHWLPNDRLLAAADSGPEKCVFWQMQVLVSNLCKYQCFLTKLFFFFFWGGGGTIYIYIYVLHILYDK